MSLLSLGLHLEDPFDTGPAAAPDTVSLLEFNHTLSYVSDAAYYTDCRGRDRGSQQFLLCVRVQAA
jgi:hypothetical protein